MDTEGLVLRAKVHSAKVPDHDGIKHLLLKGAEAEHPRMRHVWLGLDAGYRGQDKGGDWVEKNRRMAKDHERLCSTGEAFVHAAMTRVMARRLARA